MKGVSVRWEGKLGLQGSVSRLWVLVIWSKRGWCWLSTLLISLDHWMIQIRPSLTSQLTHLSGFIISSSSSSRIKSKHWNGRHASQFDDLDTFFREGYLEDGAPPRLWAWFSNGWPGCALASSARARCAPEQRLLWMPLGAARLGDTWQTRYSQPGSRRGDTQARWGDTMDNKVRFNSGAAGCGFRELHKNAIPDALMRRGPNETVSFSL